MARDLASGQRLACGREVLSVRHTARCVVACLPNDFCVVFELNENVLVLQECN